MAGSTCRARRGTRFQHPVEKTRGHYCNPLSKKRECNTNFKEPKDLDYCKTTKNLDNDSKKLECEYLDEFDLLTSEFPAADDFKGTFLLPTHIQRFTHKMLCPRKAQYCDKRYEITNFSESFVADVERFTLLIDHSFLIADNTKEYNHESIVGFMKFCPPVKLYGIEEALRNFDHPSCGRMVIPSYGDNPPRYDELVQFWDDSYKWPEDFQKRVKDLNPIFSIKSGDIFRIGPLIELLRLDMDGNDHDLRKKGFVLLVDLNYRNVKTNTLPNNLPPIYEMSFRVMNRSEFKSMSTENTGAGTRTITDTHGIYFATHQASDIRAFSPPNTLVSWFGLGIILQVCRWLVLCLFLNASTVSEADNLEKEIRPPLLLKEGFGTGSFQAGGRNEAGPLLGLG